MPPEAPSGRAALDELERMRTSFGGPAPARRRALLEALARLELASAADVLRLHEILCFARAYPDDRAMLRLASRMLAGFERRPDLARHRAALADSGIAGTRIDYRFYAPTARWLALRWHDRLTIDWPEFERAERLEVLLPLLAHPAESPGLDEIDLGLRGWIRRMKGPRETDAEFLVRRWARLPFDDQARDLLYDELDPPLSLAPGPDTPARTREPQRVRAPWFPRRPLGGRPDLAREARRRPRAVRPVSAAEGARWIDLARAAMVARARDLDLFAYGSPYDVRVVEWDEGLRFVVIGAIPERRLLLESVYAWLTVRNGVPMGYVLVGALYRSCEMAYNVFETFRGGDAAKVYARALATARALFGVDTFTIVPYQLGDDNDEALDSGAWWFYAKLGFAPRDPATRRLATAERRRVAADPKYRSSRATLKRLARENLFFALGSHRRDVMGELELPNVGLAVTDFLATYAGAARVEAGRHLAHEAAVMLGASMEKLASPERLAWERWAPLTTILPGVARWSPAEKRALVEVVRAKGGQRESDFVGLFDRHDKLRRAIRALAARG